MGTLEGNNLRHKRLQLGVFQRVRDPKVSITLLHRRIPRRAHPMKRSINGYHVEYLL